MKKLALTFIFSFLVCSGYGQESDDLFTRLQGISDARGTVFFNVDGIGISTQKLAVDFSARNCALWFYELKIKENELTASDSLLGFRNFYLFKKEERYPNLFQQISYYFVESPDKQLISFAFTNINKHDREFERHFIELVCNDLIPESIYHSLSPDSVDFAGRKIWFESSCRWMNVNNVQCPKHGQMNWSIHRDMEGALSATENQYAITKTESMEYALSTMENYFLIPKTESNEKGLELVSDDFVDVIFEGVETTARKVVYEVMGEVGQIISRSGSTRLIIYYVAAPVRGNYVSCVMSFWESDEIQPSGLPRLLEQVMKLKK